MPRVNFPPGFAVDALLVGALAALGTVVGMLYWVLLVRPHQLLGLWSGDDSWAEDLPHLGWLQSAGAVLVLLVGFFTGLAVAFLAATAN